MVGVHGEADLEVSNGGTIRGSHSPIGFWSDSIGRVTVTGTNSILDLSRTMDIGRFGRGELTISDGGTVTTNGNAVVIGAEAGGSGIAIVTGAGSLWDNSGGLYVAHLNGGRGELTISNGAKVTCSRSHVDGTDISVGLASITGMDSHLEISDYLVVGHDHEANMMISSGGRVTAVRGHLGYQAGGKGTVHVTGASSLWENSGDLYVGRFGDANLAVSDGGKVTSDSGYVSYHDGSISTVNIKGANSLWQNSGNLYIGGSDTEPGGTGLLSVSDAGVVQANDVMIWNTGIVSGDSILRANTVANKGTIKPGDSIGTLTVEGDLTMDSGSCLEIEIGNTGNSDKLSVTGAVQVRGGTVEAVLTKRITDSQEYTIIEAASVERTSDGFDCPAPALYSLTLDYLPDSVLLSVTPRPFDDPYIVTTSNQRSVGSALQQIAGGGGNSITAALQSLYSVDEVRNCYDQLSGQSRPSLAPVTNTGNSRHVSTVSNRLHNVRGGVSYEFGGGPLLAMAEPDSVVGERIPSSTYDVSPNGQTFAVGNGASYLSDQKWGFWGKGYAVFGDRESESGAPGYQYTVYGAGFGFDCQFTDALLLGITGGYSDGDIDSFSSRDASTISSIPLGIYGSWNAGDWYLDSILSYADLEYETERHVDLTAEKLSGEFDGDQISGYLEGGYNWRCGKGCLIQPLASFQFSHLNLDSYTESGGSSGLGYDDQSYESYKGSLGVRLAKQLGRNNKATGADVELRGRWIHEFGDAQSQVDTHFASDPGTIFTVSDEDVSRNSIALGTSVRWNLAGSTQLFASYDASLNADNTFHIVSAGLEHRW
jgi:T5SS/PEP-CTERM-associated repeat protein